MPAAGCHPAGFQPAGGRLQQQRQQDQCDREENSQDLESLKNALGLNQTLSHISGDERGSAETQNRSADSETLLIRKPARCHCNRNAIDDAYACAGDHAISQIHLTDTRRITGQYPARSHKQATENGD